MIYLYLALMPVILISLYGITVQHEIVDEDALD